MKSTIEMLKEMRVLLDNPKHWVKGMSEKKLEDGSYAFCVIGAADHLSGWQAFPRDDVLDVLRDVTGSGSIANWNDDPATTHQNVLDALDSAIGRLE